MYQTQRFVNVIVSQLFGEYIYRMLALMTAMIFLTISNSSFALAPNLGATCPANFSQSSLTNADYSSLVSAVNTDNYVTVAGNAAGSIPLQIRMTTSELNGPPTTGSFRVQTIGSNNAFNILRDFPSVNSVTSIDLDFRNSITSQPIFLTNVAMSAFDIDYVSNTGNSFDDYVLFTGVTESGATIDGSFQPLTASGSNILSFREVNTARATFPGLGLYINGANGDECTGNNLDTKCQGSVQFSEPVRSVKVRYSNANFRITQQNPTNQQIFFRVDNYCYVPQYIFSGTVFDDNGGITAAQANANEPNFTTGTYNNANYFNGVFNSPPESGIAGSTVRLVSCSNTSTIYATQPSGTGATIGQYQFSVPLSTFGTNRSICLIESRTGATYPVRTTSDNINTGFATTTYNYPSRNFGRVIPENAALVLRKFQFVNDCSTALNYNTITTTSDPRTGFSTEGINGNIVPGQCIAYRITATNRANTPITNSVVQDRLQERGQNGALVTSILANPVASTTDYASDSVPIGQNGLVKTNPFPLNQRTSRDFYFNTKYGTTNGNP
jgi:hypothetical protein